MQYGISYLSVIPVYFTPSELNGITTQLLFGDYFKITSQKGDWVKIKISYDNCIGWIKRSQTTFINKEIYTQLQSTTRRYSLDIVSHIEIEQYANTVILGSLLPTIKELPFEYHGTSVSGKRNKLYLLKTAALYLNTPEHFGGKTPFGIDAGAFVQMVYKINGYSLLRTPLLQSAQGTALSFVEESEPGDLAFFDNDQGIITHVGIIMKENYIIHVAGKVRVDRLDHTGIFNNEINNYTHTLRVIKKII